MIEIGCPVDPRPHGNVHPPESVVRASSVECTSGTLSAEVRPWRQRLLTATTALQIKTRHHVDHARHRFRDKPCIAKIIVGPDHPVEMHDAAINFDVAVLRVEIRSAQERFFDVRRNDPICHACGRCAG